VRHPETYHLSPAPSKTSKINEVLPSADWERATILHRHPYPMSFKGLDDIGEIVDDR